MLGTYVKHPIYGLGKVIKLERSCCSELVYFFKANDALHNGGDGSCENKHGWWLWRSEIREIEYIPPLAALIERRQQ